MEYKKHLLGLVNYFAVDCDGRGGGLTILWSQDVILSPLEIFQKIISMLTSALRMNRIIVRCLMVFMGIRKVLINLKHVLSLNSSVLGSQGHVS